MIDYDFYYAEEQLLGRNFAKDLNAHCYYKVANADADDNRKYAANVYFNAASENGVAFDIYKKVEGKWTLLDGNEIIGIGEYKIELSTNKVSTPNAMIRETTFKPFYLTVNPLEIDSVLSVVDGDKGGSGAKLNDALKIYYNGDNLADVLKKDDAYISNGVTTVLTEDGDTVYVYYNGNKMNVKISDSLEIQRLPYREDGEWQYKWLLVKDIGKAYITHSIGDETGIAGESETLTLITTTVRIEFENFIFEVQREVEVENDGEVTVETVTEYVNYLETTFNWAIVTACNNVLGEDDKAYTPVKNGGETPKIEYGDAIDVPKARYGDGVILRITNSKDVDEKFVAVDVYGATALYGYSETAEGNLGDRIEKTFDEYVAEIIRKGGTGNYKLYAQTANYTDNATGIKYVSAVQEYAFTVTARNIGKEGENIRITVTGEYSYTGSQITPDVYVLIDGVPCKAGVDYTVSYGENLLAGTKTGSITVNGTGVYEGEKTVEFDIAKAANKWTILSMSVWNHNAYNADEHIIISYAPVGRDSATYKIEKFEDKQWKSVAGLEAFKIDAKGKIIDDQEGAITDALNGLRDKNRLIATIAESDNYYGDTTDFEFDIEALQSSYAAPQLMHLTTGAGKNDVYTGHILSIGIQNYNPTGMKAELDDGLTLEGNVLYATDAGTYTVTITLTGEDSVWSDGYEGVSRTFTWTVNKQKVTIPAYGVRLLTYNGQAQTYLPAGFDSATMEISENTGTNADTYTAVIKLKDTDNYEWANNAQGEIPYEFEIKQANNEWTALSITEWYSKHYDAAVNRIAASAAFGYAQATYKIETYVGGRWTAVEDLNGFKIDANGKIIDDKNGKITDALNKLRGQYRLTAAIAESDNFTEATDSFEFEIEVLLTTYATPRLLLLTTGAGKNNAYTGHELSIGIQNLNLEGMDIELSAKNGFSRVGGTLYATEAGTYTVTIELSNEDSVWSNGTSNAITLEWVIRKQTVAAPAYGETVLTYTGSEQTYLPEGFDDSVMEISENTGTNVARYTATISLKDPDNYEWSSNPDAAARSYVFDITKATNRYTTLSIATWYYRDYNPDVNRIVFDAAFGLVQATYKIEKYVDETWTDVEGLEDFKLDADGNVIDEGGKIAEILNGLRGKYRLTAVIEGNDNYSEITATSYEFSIVILPTKYDTPELMYLTAGIGKNDVYTGHVLSISIQNFNIAGMDIDLSEGLTIEGNVLYATNAGTYTATITLLSDDSEWGDGLGGNSRTFTWTIGKIKVAVPDYGTTKLSYNGSEQTYLPKGFDAATMEISDNTGTDADTYTAKVRLKDPVNYEWDNPDYGVEIPYQFEIESATRLFITIVCILAAAAAVAAFAALAQWLMHRQRLKVFAMANETDSDENDGEDVDGEEENENDVEEHDEGGNE
ncbi:MAG: hypothetical protein NC332_04190 [Firmicutes bacterium]|nr:hypothetical protein [Bacillota bacterium]